MLVANCPTYCNFVLSFEIGSKSPIFVFLKIVLAILGPLTFHINFIVSLSILQKSQLGFGLRDCVEFVCQLWGVLPFNNIK